MIMIPESGCGKAIFFESFQGWEQKLVRDEETFAVYEVWGSNNLSSK